MVHIFRNFKVAFVSLVLIASSAFAEINTTLSFYNDALRAQVIGPTTLSAGKNANNPFTVKITDANGAPYTGITKEWLSGTVEMTNMDMGVTKVTRVSDVLDAAGQLQGVIALNPIFSMKGPWKLSLTMTVSDGNGGTIDETQTINFNVTK